MTLSTTSNKKSFSPDGVQTQFAFTFPFIANSHIQAVLKDAAGVETTWVEVIDYTLAGAGAPSGGTLTAGLHIQRVAAFVDFEFVVD